MGVGFGYLLASTALACTSFVGRGDLDGIGLDGASAARCGAQCFFFFAGIMGRQFGLCSVVWYAFR